MIIKEIYSESDKLYKAIEDRRLNDVFLQLNKLISLYSNPYLISKTELLHTTYSYMIKYMLQGVDDPQRNKLYNELIVSLYQVVDMVIDELLEHEASDYLYDKRRYLKLSGDFDIKKLSSKLKQLYCDYNSKRELDEKSIDVISILRQIEQIQEEIFAIIVAKYPLTDEDLSVITHLINENEFGEITSSIVVSALTVSTICHYNEKSIVILYETHAVSLSEDVKQRALCGALISSFIHRNRVGLSSEITKRVSLFSEDYAFCRDVRNQFLQFISSMDTEKISEIFTKEIIPELMKIEPKLRDKISIKGEDDENLVSMFEKNPEWEKKLEELGITSKLKELNELQLEGSDVLITTFSSLKSYPFFNNISNWLRPFTLENSEIYGLLSKEVKITNMLEKSMFICSSDKYSLALAFSKIPKQNIDAMLGEMPTDVDMNEIMNNDINERGGVEKNISTLYIQDLYRLYKLAPQKFRLGNLFSEHIDLFKVEILRPLFEDAETMRLLGEFYLKKGYFGYAKSYFERLTVIVPDAGLYQKLGYCKQMLNDFDGAITEYIKAEDISADFWTIHHLALCYRRIGNTAKAIDYYNAALMINPENLAIEMQLGHTILATGNYAEALKHYYKVDFLEEGSVKVWRAIAWCLLMENKFEQAENYYEKILAEKPDAEDYLNAAHVALAQRKMIKAKKLYLRCIEEKNNSIDYFKTQYDNDIPSLLKVGVEQEDIAIMRDIVLMS